MSGVDSHHNLLHTTISLLTISGQKVHPFATQGIIINFYRNLKHKSGIKLLRRAQVYEWHRKFLKGREAVQNEVEWSDWRKQPRLSPPYRRWSWSNGFPIASEVGINYGSAPGIITDDDLDNLKMSAPSDVPTAVDSLPNRGGCFSAKDRYLRHQIESWIYHYKPEGEQAIIEWRNKKGSASVKFILANKALMFVFWDYRSILHIYFLHKCRSIISP